jgi:hypothetical protein
MAPLLSELLSRKGFVRRDQQDDKRAPDEDSESCSEREVSSESRLDGSPGKTLSAAGTSSGELLNLMDSGSDISTLDELSTFLGRDLRAGKDASAHPTSRFTRLVWLIVCQWQGICVLLLPFLAKSFKSFPCGAIYMLPCAIPMLAA